MALSAISLERSQRRPGLPTRKKPEDQLEFQDELPNRLSSLNADAPVRLFCQDECRVGLMPTVRHRITLPGVKPIQTPKPAYEYFYLYGAVEPETGQRFFLPNMSVSTATASKTSRIGFRRRFREATT